MKLDIVWTTQFKKDYKLSTKRGLDIDLLDDIVRLLAKENRYRSRFVTML